MSFTACVRLDGHVKTLFASRAEARRECPDHQSVYRCRFCARWHRATKRPQPLSVCDVPRVVRIVKRAA